MIDLLWDASALTKRYILELGSSAVELLIAAGGATSVCTYTGYAETCWVLRRKLNSGDLRRQMFDEARQTLRQDVYLSPDFKLLSVDNAGVMDGIDLSDRHNINSSDAAILATYLRYAHPDPEGKQILIASDLRLLRAAAAEGLSVLNPETIAPADLALLLA
ncbi:MAG TPA: type II toxin-antitoxin system VapC family toxin [Armatimonadota bacterium]|nr:type II toxin-antitoxin system VapC family toxin [Armatimonadota bacterium]